MVSLLPRRMLVATGAAIGALVLAGSVSLSTASADPMLTPTPAPTATPTASPTPAPMATPTASPSPTPTPSVDATLEPDIAPTPVPRPTPQPTETEAAATSETTAPRTPSKARRATERAADPDATADDRFSYTIATTCVSATEFALAEITLESRLSVDLTLYYALSAGSLNIPGSVTVPATGSAVVEAELLSESRDFVVRFYDDPNLVGTTGWVASQSFTVAPCLAVFTECGTVNFGSGNDLPVTVIYGEGPAAEADPDEAQSFVLAPHGNQVIRVDVEILYWFAENVQPGAGDNVVVASAGEDPVVTIPQGCEPAPLSVAVVGCAGPGKTGALRINVEFGPADTFAVEVLDARGERVFFETSSAAAEPSGSAGYTTRLPGLGRYRFNYYLNDLTTPRESSVFRMQDCIDVTGGCGEATFTSAAGNLPLEVTWSNGPDNDTFTLAPGESVTVDFRHEVVSYLARTPRTDPRLFVTAGGGASHKVTLGCPAPGAGDDGLADTGAPSGALTGLLAAGVLTVTGSALLARRRPAPGR